MRARPIVRTCVAYTHTVSRIATTTGCRRQLERLNALVASVRRAARPVAAARKLGSRSRHQRNASCCAARHAPRALLAEAAAASSGRRMRTERPRPVAHSLLLPATSTCTAAAAARPSPPVVTMQASGRCRRNIRAQDSRLTLAEPPSPTDVSAPFFSMATASICLPSIGSYPRRDAQGCAEPRSTSMSRGQTYTPT
jgi:hypothetical protein